MIRNSKGWFELGLTQHYIKSIVTFQRSDKTKERGFELAGAVNCAKVNIQGKLIKDKDSFSKICYVVSSGSISGPVGIQSCLWGE